MVFYNILESVTHFPHRFPAPVETRQFVDDFTTMSVANGEDDVTRSICSVALELGDKVKKRKALAEQKVSQ